MANVVGREIYGPLTSKQKEYLEIVQNSGRYLLSLVNEISHLGVMDEYNHALNLASVDIEMLCQQVLNILEELAKRKEQKLKLSLEPAKSRIWVLDKDKIKQLLYHLISSMIRTANSGSLIRIHISYKGNSLNLAISVSHPWLGEGLTSIDPYFGQLAVLNASTQPTSEQLSNQPLLPSAASASAELATSADREFISVNSFNRSCESLRLLLSRALAELHGGQIDILGTPESGYRYVVSLPELALTQESL
jgi:signal transduction histidine kinase